MYHCLIKLELISNAKFIDMHVSKFQIYATTWTFCWILSICIRRKCYIKGSTLCYKDGPQLPPLIFTISCMEHESNVIFYNKRLDGVYYPVGYQLLIVVSKLCEVIVLGNILKFENDYRNNQCHTSFYICYLFTRV